MTTAPDPRPSRGAFWLVFAAMLAIVLGLNVALVRSHVPRRSTVPDTNCDSPAAAKPEAAPPVSFLAFGACGDDGAAPPAGRGK